MEAGKGDGNILSGQDRPESTIHAPRSAIFFPREDFLEVDQRQTLEQFRNHIRELKGLDSEYARIMDSSKAIQSSLERLFEHSKWTARHSAEVGFLAFSAAKHVGFTGQRLTDFVIGATLHDMGKLTVDKAILDKPDKLDPGEEEAQIHAHPANSLLDIITIPSLNPRAALVAFGHHSVQKEPYPFDALAQDTIANVTKVLGEAKALKQVGGDYDKVEQLFSPQYIESIFPQLVEEWEVVTAADVVHALRSFRPYKGSYFEEVVREHTKAYDPAMINTLLQAYRQIPTLHGENQLS